jgi:hypothetical protein
LKPYSLAGVTLKEKIAPMTGKFLVGVAVAVVVLILLAGLVTLVMGGETSRNWSNRLMRLRVLAQFIAILIIMAVLYFSAN